MALFARMTTRVPRNPSPAPLAVSLVGAAATFELAAEAVSALPEGALWIASLRALIVADLHLEKASAFARGGQLLPPYDTRATLARLTALITVRKPDIVVSLGDSFHDAHGPWRLNDEDGAALRSLTQSCDWVWISGNHDAHAPSFLGGAAHEELKLGALTLRHEPELGAAYGEIAGHLHPCAKVAGRGRSVRRRCFATDGARLVMPAFGALAGGLNIRDRAFAALFPEGACALVLARDRVLPIAGARLVSD